MLLLAAGAFAIALTARAPAHAATTNDRARGHDEHRCDTPAAAASLPARRPDASGWRALVGRFTAAEASERERLIADELSQGNLPSFLHRLRPVRFDGVLPGGQPVQVVTCVMPDYLAVGSDHDFMLMPMALDSAVRLARRFGFLLPTRRMVDAIYRQAEARMAPHPLPAGDTMRSTAYYDLHDRLIREQRTALHAPAGMFTAGHKKDIVSSRALWRQPGQIAIYGWHRPDGRPIQPLSTVHGARYADYSHGVRLVSVVAYVDGVARSLFDLLADPVYAPMLSDEGPLPGLAEWMDAGARPPGLASAATATDPR